MRNFLCSKKVIFKLVNSNILLPIILLLTITPSSAQITKNNVISDLQLQIFQNKHHDTLKIIKIFKHEDILEGTIIRRKFKKKNTFNYWEKIADSIINVNLNNVDELSADEKGFFMTKKAILLFHMGLLKEADELSCTALNFGLVNNSKHIQSQALRSLAFVAFKKHELQDVIDYCDEGLLLGETNNMGVFLKGALIASSRLDKFSLANKYQKKLRAWLERNANILKQRDAYELYFTYLLIGIHYHDVATHYDNNELLTIAKKYFDKVEDALEDDKIIANIKDKHGAFGINNLNILLKLDLARIKIQQGKYAEGRINLEKLEHLPTYNSYKKKIDHVIAKSFYAEKNYEKAKEYCEKAKASSKYFANDPVEIDLNYLLAKSNAQLNNNKEAYLNAINALKLMSKKDGKQYSHKKADITKFLGLHFRQKNQKDSMLFYNNWNYDLNLDFNRAQHAFDLLKTDLEQEFKIKLKNKELEKNMELSNLTKNNNYTLYLFITVFVILISASIVYIFQLKRKQKKQTQSLINQLDTLKKQLALSQIVKGPLEDRALINRHEIESKMNCKLNDTDWNILSLLIENPITTNKELSDQVARSIAGIRSSLQKMYSIFNIPNGPRDKRVLLIIKVVELF